MALNFLELSPSAWASISEDKQRRLSELAPLLPESYRIKKGGSEQIIATMQQRLSPDRYTKFMLGDDASYFTTARKYLSATEQDRQKQLKMYENGEGIYPYFAKMIRGLQADSIHTWEQVLALAEKKAAPPPSPPLALVPPLPEPPPPEPEEQYEPEPIEQRLVAVGEELTLIAGELAASLRAAKAQIRNLDGQIAFLRTSLEEAEERALRAREQALGAWKANIEEIAAAVPENKQLLAAAAELASQGRRVKAQRVRHGLPYKFVWKQSSGKIEYGQHFLDALDELQTRDQDRVKQQLARFASPTVGPHYPSFDTQKIKRDGQVRHTPEGAQKSRASDELRFTWSHSQPNQVIMHYLWRKGENVGIGESEA